MGQVGKLDAGDVAVVAGYLLGSLILGLVIICRSKGNIESLFLARRSMTWAPIGLSLFASNIGSVNYVGIAGNAAASGLAVIMFEWNAAFLLILLGWIFLPVYIASGIYTMPEYLHWRFGGKRLRIYLSVIALVTYVFATVPADLFSCGLFLNQALQINLYAAVTLLLVIALIFTALGGLEVVIVTDSLAVLIMVFGGVLLCGIGFSRVDGFGGLEYKYMHSVPNTTLMSNSTCGYPSVDAFHIFRHPWTSSYPSVGLILRTTLGSVWYWCSNQVLVQRALAAKNITHAKAACVFAGYLKLLPMVLMIFPGMISRALFPDEVGCADPDVCEAVCGSRVGCSNIALPKLVLEILPTGLRGLMVASVIAAVVSSLTSIFNSASAIFTMDVWLNVRPRAREFELIVVGRVFVVILVTVSILWIPIMSQAEGGQIFAYSTAITGYLASPTCAIFILAMFWGRINECGAFWGMILAQLWGLTRFVMDLVYPAPLCGEADDRPLFVAGWHTYYHAISQVLLTFVVATIISFVTEVPTKERLAGLTYWTRFFEPQRDKENLQKTAIVTETNVSVASEPEAQDLDDFDKCPNELQGSLSVHIEPEYRSLNDFLCKSILKPMWKRFTMAMFGTASRGTDQNGSSFTAESRSERLAMIQQTSFWRNFTNIQAVLLLTVAAFLYGFFF